MAITVKEKMLKGKYAWKAVGGDDPKKTKMDAKLFSRKEGYEVIPMIQKVVNHLNYTTEAQVQAVEKVINDDLPGNVRGQKKVLDWLINHIKGDSDGLEGDKAKTVIAMVISRMWTDAALKKKFLADPNGVLKEEGLDVPAGITIKALENTDNVRYIGFTPDTDVNKNAEKVIQLFHRLIPIPVGKELRLVQNSADTRYIIIPSLPKGVSPGKLSSTELMQMANGSGVEATYHDTTQTLEAETTEVTVTETTAAQDVEAVTTVVAVAEIVAT